MPLPSARPALCRAAFQAFALGLALSGPAAAQTHQHAPAAPAAAAPAGPSFTAGPLTIVAPWSRATPGGARVAGGFMAITNSGREPDRLIGGTLPVAGRVEVHEMAMTGGVMVMRPLGDGLTVPPGGTVELKPGGLHLMFMELSGGLKEGDTVKGTLVFEKAGTVEVEYRVRGIGAR